VSLFQFSWSKRQAERATSGIVSGLRSSELGPGKRQGSARAGREFDRAAWPPISVLVVQEAGSLGH
jgi:hypothetical protein